MRKIQLNTFSLLFIALLTTSSWNVRGQVEEKRVDRSFDVSGTTRLSINNRFGKVHINTWDQNRITVQVRVEAEGSDEATKDILGRINIDIDESSSEIRVETEIAESRKKWRHERFRIDYTIKMPKNNPLEIEHRHGDIYLDHFAGPLELDLAHGQIIAEELTGRSRIALQHGNGGRIAALNSGSLEIQHYQRLRVGSLGSMDVEIAHASLEIEKTGDLDLELRHSQIDIGSGGAMNLSLQHSKFKASSLLSLKTDMQHSNITVGKLERFLHVDCNHSQVEVDGLAKNFTSVIFDGNHSYLGLGLEQGTTATIEAELSYGKLKYLKSDINMDYVNIEDQREEYKGRIGNNPKGRIRVDANFTDCAISFN